VNLPNPEKKLRPGMYASAAIRVRLMPDGTPEPTGLEGKYICPMHPEVVRDKAGRCDICEMPLEKVPERKVAAKKKDAHEGHNHSKEEMKAPEKGVAAKKKDVHEGHDHSKEVTKTGEKGKVLAIPASAILDTGRRKITYRQTNDGAFELVEVDLGPRADGKDDQGNKNSYFVVLSGLKVDDRIVVRGGFLLDSARQIEGMPSLLYPEGQKAAQLHSGHDMPAPKAPK
jgi:Cu(I)/Ag(I) efflux system membrane fusion protein